MGKTKTHRSLSSLKRQFKYRKPICPFICSTFQDFQVERDILVKKVFPAIDALCRERGTYCAPVDLRWGINDHQASSGQIINLCLDYVARCAPFFICILGERYGSCRPPDSTPLPKSYKDLSPNAHWMDKNLLVAAALGHDWVAQEPYCSSSVTALEIAQRNLLSSDLGDDFSFYYVRQQEHLDHLFVNLPEEERIEKLKMYQPESNYSNEQVRKLKAQIAKRGLPLKYFKTPEELRLLVLCDWKAVVDCLYPPLYDDIPQIYMESVKEWMAHEAFAESRRRVYISTPELDALFDDLTQFALTSLDEPPPAEEEKPLSRAQTYSSLLRRKKEKKKPQTLSTLLLTGERGCGKSSVIANWCKKFEQNHPEVKVITHFVGSSAQSTDLHSLMARFTREIQNEYPDFVDAINVTAGEDCNGSHFHSICEAFHAALTLGPCVLILDGVDELAESYGCSYQQVKEMSWLPYPLPPQCKVIITCAYSDTAHKALSQRNDTRILSIPLLKDARSKSKVVREYLAIHCKCLDKAQLNHIVNSKLSDRPIFLTVLANELRVFGVYSRLDYHLESYLDALSIRDLWSKIILRWVRDYSWCTEQGTKSETGDNETGEITGWVADALRLLACSRNGLTTSEILDMLKDLGYQGKTKVTMLDWALFRSAAMDSLLERPEGLINFFHQHFKEAVEHTLLGSPTPGHSHSCDKLSQNIIQEVDYSVALCPKRSLDRCRYHRHIAVYFLKQKPDNRQLDELPWQLERAGEFEQLSKVLSEPRMFLKMAGEGIMNRRRLKLVHYWKILRQQGYSITDTYWAMLRRALGKRGQLGSNESLTTCSVDSELSGCHLSPARESPFEPSIPHIIKTSPSLSLSSNEPSEELDEPSEECSTEDDASAVLSSKCSSRTSLSSEKSSGSTGSYASSEVDVNEAFIQGEARCPKAMALLTMTTGQFLSLMSCFVDAEKMLLTAHDRLGQISFSGDCQRLLCELEESLGNMYLFQLHKEKAVHWFTRALCTVEELLIILRNSEDEKSLVEMKGRLLEKLGNMCTHNKDFEKAETMLTRARACFEEAKSCTGKAMVDYRIGFLRMQQGDIVSAERLFSEVLLKFERWFGKNHPRLAELINDFAGLLCHPDNKSSQNELQAEYLYRRALQIRETCFGPDHLLVATSLFHLGMLLKRRPDRLTRQEALSLLERALDIRMTKLGEKHILTRNIRKSLNELQVIQLTQNKFTSEQRNLDLPYSSLTWHEEELLNFERRAQHKAECEKQKKSMVKSEGESAILSALSQSDDLTSYKNASSPGADKTDDVYTSDSLEATDEKLNAGHAQHSTAQGADCMHQRPMLEHANMNANRENGLDELVGGMSEAYTYPDDRQKQSRYLDSFVFHISEPPPGGHRGARPHSTMLATKHYFQNASNQNKSKGSRTLVETLSHYASIADERRIHSAPPCNRMPVAATSISNVYHRLNCPVPDPNSINLSNAYSVVYGPHTSIESLLSSTESPRYGFISCGSIHHSSSWYPPGGRHSPCHWLSPRKRLQKRPTQNKHSLVDRCRGASNMPLSHRDVLYTGDPNNYRSTTKGVHFDGCHNENLQGQGLLAH